MIVDMKLRDILDFARYWGAIESSGVGKKMLGDKCRVYWKNRSLETDGLLLME